MPSIRTALVAAAAVAVTGALVATAAPASAAPAPHTIPAGVLAHGYGMSPNTTVHPNVITSNEQTAWNYFIGKGLTAEQTAGVIGNLDQESGMDPTIFQYGGGPGRGIAQWGAGGRWDTYSGDNENDFASGEGLGIYDLTAELDFVWFELTQYSYYGLSQLQAAGTVHDAVVAFQDKFEGCGTCNTSAREQYANNAYAAYAG